MRSFLLAGVIAVYLLALVELTLVRFPQRDPEPNLMPMRTISACWDQGGRPMVINILGNLALLAPVGVILPLARPGRAGVVPVAASALLLSGTIEVAQFASGHRMADVDDLILNTIGALIAYGMLCVPAIATRAIAETVGGRSPRLAIAGPSEAGPSR